MLCLFLCRRFLKVTEKEEDTDTIGIYSDAFGVALAILMGLIIVSAWTSYNQTTNQVRQEALDIDALYKKSQATDDETKNLLRAELKTYVTDLINLEWPLLPQGGYSKKVDEDLFQIFKTLVHSKRTNKIEEFIFQELYNTATNIKEQRSEYLLNATSSVTPAMWVTLIISSIIAFFLLALTTRTRFSLHILLQFLYALGTSLMFLLIILLDRPFYQLGGEIDDLPFKNLLSEWELDEASPPQPLSSGGVS